MSIVLLCKGEYALGPYDGTDVSSDPQLYCITVPLEEMGSYMGGALNAAAQRTIEEGRRQARLRVNLGAGKSREQYFTNIPGQAITLTEKQYEVRAYEAAVAAGKPIVPADYPICQAEAEGTKTSLADTIARVQLAMTQTNNALGEIEGIRQAALREVREATTLAAADAINPAYP